MKVLITAILIFLISGVAQAKAPLQFDAASVRPNRLNDHIVSIHVGPGGMFAARGYTLKLLIQQAYEVKGFQIKGGESWMGTELYDVEARGSATATRHQLNQMLQRLIEDRFALRMHRVKKEMSGFELTVAGERAAVTPLNGDRGESHHAA